MQNFKLRKKLAGWPELLGRFFPRESVEKVIADMARGRSKKTIAGYRKRIQAARSKRSESDRKKAAWLERAIARHARLTKAARKETAI